MYPKEAFEQDILDEDTVPERTQRVCPSTPPSPAVLTNVSERIQESVSKMQTQDPVRVLEPTPRLQTQNLAVRQESIPPISESEPCYSRSVSAQTPNTQACYSPRAEITVVSARPMCVSPARLAQKGRAPNTAALNRDICSEIFDPICSKFHMLQFVDSTEELEISRKS